MAILTLTDVCKSYGAPDSAQTVPVLRQVSLSLEAAESIAIVGPSGCGKSTLLNVMGTLDAADSGEVSLLGELLSSAKPEHLAQLRSQHIGFIFQQHHLLPQCSVLENVLVPTMALAQRDAAQCRARAEALLKRVGLEHRLHWRPSQLSGGERQRVAVVRALINEPKLILADEPTGALDEKNAANLTELLLELQRETGVALVLVTHHQAQAASMSRVLTMREGSLA
jgi:lipoprotein-releasing system ATP-binding protein